MTRDEYTAELEKHLQAVQGFLTKAFADSGLTHDEKIDLYYEAEERAPDFISRAYESWRGVTEDEDEDGDS